jgi:hypothetical protein
LCRLPHRHLNRLLLKLPPRLPRLFRLSPKRSFRMLPRLLPKLPLRRVGLLQCRQPRRLRLNCRRLLQRLLRQLPVCQRLRLLRRLQLT